MGFLTNVLEYGWNAGCIITEAERTANRICKGIKTTIIPDEEEKEEQTNPDRADEKEDDEDYNFRIIFHQE